MSGIKYAGEYDLKEMKILTSAGNILDIKNMVQVIEILESINSPAITGTLSFCSPELLRSNRTRVSKSYTDTIDKTVENVIRDTRYLNSKKKLFIEKTNGIRKVVSPNLRPYTFINNLKE